MGRIFEIDLPGRSLSIKVMPIDEGWELWLCEGERRLLLCATVSMDEAVAAWGRGEDAVRAEVVKFRARIAGHDLSLLDMLPPAAPVDEAALAANGNAIDAPPSTRAVTNR